MHIQHTPQLRKHLAAIASLYAAMGLVSGFIMGGIGPILRTQGFPLAAMGWVSLLYVPFGVAFFWASRLDRWSLPGSGRRTGWILAAQGLAIVLLVAIGCGRHWPPPLLLALGVIAAMAMATTDVALDAWSVEHIGEEHRPAASGAKLGGLWLGSLLSGGVLVALYPRLGWLTVFLVLAALIALSSLPALWLTGEDRPASNTSPAPASMLHALRRPGMARRLLRTVAFSIPLVALFSFNRLMLVDARISLERIGWVLGTLSPLVSIGASLLAPWLIHGNRRRLALGVFAGACALSGLLVVAGLEAAMPGLAILGSILAAAGTTGAYIVVFALILGWARGEQAATDYALLYGFSRFIGTLAALALPSVIAWSGWPAFYAACAVAVVAGASYFNAGIEEPPAETGTAGDMATHHRT